MKLKHIYLPVILFMLMGIASCQKDNEFPEEEPAGTIADKIQHKWKINFIATNSQFAGVNNKVSYNGTPEEYVEFRSDKKMYTYFRSAYDTSSYSVVSNKVISIDNDQATIQELTDNTLILFSRDNTDFFGYFEVTYSLSR